MFGRLLFLLLSFALCLPTLEASDSALSVQVDLRDPTYHNGVLYTEEGGVVQNRDLRIQARKIRYIRKMEEGELTHRLEAEGDLMVQYKGRAYVGSALEYNFVTRTGIIHQGKTFALFWYIGGDEIQINPNGDYTVTNAFITTCENRDNSWDIHAAEVHVLKEDLLTAQNVHFRLLQVPVFWLPSFKLNLHKFSNEPLLRYSINWDKSQGPQVSFRYQLFSWRNFALYGRFEYRLSTGFGGAIETDYVDPDQRTRFVTRSYLATDYLENAPDRMRRYRLEGMFHSVSPSGHTKTQFSWDKYSDVRMPGDFHSEDFEVNSAHRTLFSVSHEHPKLFTVFTVRPRVNAFESIQQDLPTLLAAFHPAALGNSGILQSGFAKLSYLSFTYSDQLIGYLAGFRSARLELRDTFYRPIPLGPLTLTPHVGGEMIFYSNSPSHQAKTLALLMYGGTLSARGRRMAGSYVHTLEPYASYIGLSRPTVTPGDHYIFTIQDGYQKLDQLQAGFRANFFSNRPDPVWGLDLHADAFFFDHTLPQTVQKLTLIFSGSTPSAIYSWENVWNFRHHLLDRTILRARWTLNENAAFSLEGRYRSKYDWRKADNSSFILDATRQESELLLSPLSDPRVTLLADLFFRFSPFWECHFQSHHGFARMHNPPYSEVKIDLFTWISAALKLRLSYTHTTKDDRVTAGISLEKAPE